MKQWFAWQTDEHDSAVTTIRAWRTHWKQRLVWVMAALLLGLFLAPQLPSITVFATGVWFGSCVFVSRWLYSQGRNNWGGTVHFIGLVSTIVQASRFIPAENAWLYGVSNLITVFAVALLVSGIAYVISKRWLKV